MSRWVYQEIIKHINQLQDPLLTCSSLRMTQGGCDFHNCYNFVHIYFLTLHHLDILKSMIIFFPERQFTERR